MRSSASSSSSGRRQWALAAALVYASCSLVAVAYLHPGASGPARQAYAGMREQRRSAAAAPAAWIIPSQSQQQQQQQQRRRAVPALYSSVKTQEPPTAGASSPPPPPRRRTEGGLRKGVRAQRLKDLLLEKELRNDISTAEFALNLDVPRVEVGAAGALNSNVTGVEGGLAPLMMTPGGVIDYERIAEKLEKNLELIDRRQQVRWLQQGAAAAAGKAQGGEGEKGAAGLQGEESTLRLARRLNETRAELKSVLQRVRQSMVGGQQKQQQAAAQVGAGAAAGAGENANATAAGGAGGRNPFTVFVREDGTVDWDGAIQSGKDLFERLQGKSPDEEHSPAPKPSASLAVIDASPAIRQLNEDLAELKRELVRAQADKDRIAELHKALKRQGLEVTKAQKGELRIADDQAIELRRRVELQRLDVEMERISAYIEQEIEQSTSIREQKLLVAEFGLLDSQLTALVAMLQDAELDASSLLELDDDELKVVASEVQDLKTRLGLVEDPGAKLEWNALQSYVQESVEKIRKGVSFYVQGTKLLASDLQYASWLISRAAQGYTLKPREVRTLQRTAKDMLTLIPFTIILIIPMTPIGHVLVFSLIQRIFPDFFPSTFTERRQVLSRMYEELDKKPLVEPPAPPARPQGAEGSGEGK